MVADRWQDKVVVFIENLKIGWRRGGGGGNLSVQVRGAQDLIRIGQGS